MNRLLLLVAALIVNDETNWIEVVVVDEWKNVDGDDGKSSNKTAKDSMCSRDWKQGDGRCIILGTRQKGRMAERERERERGVDECRLVLGCGLYDLLWCVVSSSSLIPPTSSIVGSRVFVVVVWLMI